MITDYLIGSGPKGQVGMSFATEFIVRFALNDVKSNRPPLGQIVRHGIHSGEACYLLPKEPVINSVQLSSPGRGGRGMLA